MDIIIIALIGVALYLVFAEVLKPNQKLTTEDTPQQDSIIQFPSENKEAQANSQLTQQEAQKQGLNSWLVSQVNDGKTITNEKGFIVANAIYEDKARITQDAQIYNILLREGVNTPIATNYTDDPLLISYLQAGASEATISSRPAANKEENILSRIASINTMYKQGAYAGKESNYTELLASLNAELSVLRSG